MAQARSSQPSANPTWLPWVVLTFGVALSLLAAFFLGPYWVGVCALSLALAGYSYPTPVLTGRKDPRTGAPTAAGPGQEKMVTASRLWRKAAWSGMNFGGKGALPSKAVRLVWVGAVGLALVTAVLPSLLPTPLWVRLLCGGLAFGTVASLDHVLRTSRFVEDPFEGVSVKDALQEVKGRVGLGAGFGVGGAATALFMWGSGLADRSEIPVFTYVLGAFGGALVGAALVSSLLTRKPVVERWRHLVGLRRTWDANWETMKSDPKPVLLDYRDVGGIDVLTFRAPAALGVLAFIAGKNADHIRRMYGATVKVCLMSAPGQDEEGQPDYNTVSPTDFRLIIFEDGLPDVTSPETDEEVRLLTTEAAFNMAGADMDAQVAPMFIPAMTPVSLPDAEVMSFLLDLRLPNGPSMDFVRKQLQGSVGALLNTQVLTDARSGHVFLGYLQGDGAKEMFSEDFPIFQPPSDRYADAEGYMHALSEELAWDSRWAAVMKSGFEGHAPRPIFSHEKSAILPGGQLISYQPFITRQGMTPSEFHPLAQKLQTVLNASPFVSITSFPEGPPQKGQRHASAIAVVWSNRSVPSSPELLRPTPVRGGREAADVDRWVLTGMIEKAFMSAKLPAPMLTQIKSLTKQESSGTVWQIQMLLYDCTLDDVRRVQGKIRSYLQVSWLRVEKGREGFITMYCGASPTIASFIDPLPSLEKAVSLDWEQAWLDSGITNMAGEVPRMKSLDYLPLNKKVQSMEFALPSPISVERIKMVLAKVKAASGMGFIEVTQGKGGAQSAHLLACREDPMPTLAEYDEALMDDLADNRPGVVALGASVTGEPILWDPKEAPHIKLLGGSGSGKSVGIQAALLGHVRAGSQLVVVDPTKGAADFKFAEPYSLATATTLHEAAGVMKLAYQEVVRRKNLNADYGVGSFRDLPGDVRPPLLVIAIDEFTSLIGLEPVSSKQASTPEAETERLLRISTNQAREEIGTFTAKIAREARSAGVVLLLAGQKLAVEDLAKAGARDLKDNLATVLLGKTTYGSKQSALRQPELSPDLGDAVPLGRGIWESTVGASQQIQVLYHPDEQDYLAASAAAKRAALTEEEKWDLSGFASMEEMGPQVRDVDVDNEIEDLGVLDFDWGEVNFDEADGEVDTPQPRGLLIFSAGLVSGLSFERFQQLCALETDLLIVGEPQLTGELVAASGRSDAFVLNADLPSRLEAVMGFLSQNPHYGNALWVDAEEPDLGWTEAEVAVMSSPTLEQAQHVLRLEEAGALPS